MTNKKELQELKYVTQAIDVVGLTVYLEHLIIKDNDIWYHVCTMEEEYDTPTSVWIARALNDYWDGEFEIEEDFYDGDCELCGAFTNEIYTIINTKNKQEIEVYIDNHLGDSQGTTEDEMIKDWEKLGYKLSIENLA